MEKEKVKDDTQTILIFLCVQSIDKGLKDNS